MYYICSGRSIDVAMLIKNSVCHRANQGKHTVVLTHPILITHLCAQADVLMTDEEMTLGPMKFNHDILMRFKQWAGGTPDKGGMGFFPVPNQPPPPPAAPPRIRHTKLIPTQTTDAGVDEVASPAPARRGLLL